MEDLGKGLTISNNAYAVVEDVFACFSYNPIRDAIIVYRDTLGIYDEIVVDNGKFVGFAPLGLFIVDDAVNAVVESRVISI